jgi:ParB family transcriptional regulator, chromosome partitioning protein
MSFRDRLETLVSPNVAQPSKSAGVKQDVLHHIDLERLRPSPDNPRSIYPEEEIQTLSQSLAALGQQEPITCYWSGTEHAYVILQGHCRYHAAKLAGLKSLMAVVVTEDMNAVRALAKRMAENTARNDLHPLDCARALKRLMEEGGLNQQEVAKQLGRSQAWVSGQLQLLSLPEEQQAKVAKGTVSITEARAAVVKQPRSSRKKPKQIKLTAGGITVLVTFKRVADQCSASEAWERVRSAAEQLDAKQAKDAA